MELPLSLGFGWGQGLWAYSEGRRLLWEPGGAVQRGSLTGGLLPQYHLHRVGVRGYTGSLVSGSNVGLEK